MKVSIITVVYNNQKTIECAILSVLQQTYSNIEYILIDGCSTDKTMEIVQKYQDRISVIVSEKDNGLYDAMNKGISLATGDVVGILNSDDYFCDQFVIEKVAKSFMEHSTDAVYGDLVYVKGQANQIHRYWKAGSFKRKNFLFGWMPPHPSFFVLKKHYLKLGKFNTKLKSSSDYEILLRFLYLNKLRVVYIPEVLVYMRVGGISNVSLKNRLRANAEDRAAWKVNEIKPYFFTTWLKPLRKIFQFGLRPK